jgi:phosphatidylinositol alpha-1,6-mannosyltransferase
MGGTAGTMKIPETGRLVPCDGPDELARVVAELLSDPKRRMQMGEAAREWVVANFDWETLACQAEQILPLRP